MELGASYREQAETATRRTNPNAWGAGITLAHDRHADRRGHEAQAQGGWNEKWDLLWKRSPALRNEASTPACA